MIVALVSCCRQVADKRGTLLVQVTASCFTAECQTWRKQQQQLQNKLDASRAFLRSSLFECFTHYILSMAGSTWPQCWREEAGVQKVRHYRDSREDDNRMRLFFFMARITATGNIASDRIGWYMQSKNKQRKNTVYLKHVVLKAVKGHWFRLADDGHQRK